MDADQADYGQVEGGVPSPAGTPPPAATGYLRDVDAAWALFDEAGGFRDEPDDASSSDVDSEDDADAEDVPHSAFDPFDAANDGPGSDGDDDSEEDDDGRDDATTTYPAPPPSSGGDVRQYVDAVIALRATPALPVVSAMFPYTLDPFQRRAVRHCLTGSNVLVCAPTGAGKTAIAAAATLGVLAAGKRVIYTTPLKALSNQKLAEFRALFGTHRVGLQTGDASLNPEGNVVVMTTEVLRNILFRSAAGDGVAGAGGDVMGGQADIAGAGPINPPAPGGERTALGVVPERLADVGLVVLDEVHYLGDVTRGTVWEEVIISAPPSARLLAMSATVRNPGDLGGWVSAVHGPCETLITSARPVPLTWRYAWSVPAWVRKGDKGKGRGRGSGGGGGGGGGDDDDAVRLEDLLATPKDARRAMRPRLNPILRPPRGGGLAEPRAPPDPVGLARTLDASSLLPALWFIFSRAGCDATAIDIAAAGAVRISADQRALVQAELAALQADQPEAVRPELVPALLRGVASHHAGCLPGWKGLVERLFQAGALQVVVATETLAAGINMPARTSVISALARRRAAAVDPLTHNELLQMAGRAGRRGYDTTGTCVLLHTPAAGLGAAAALLARGPERLTSQFRPGYSMVLNLVATRPLAAARAFVDRSYGCYLASEGRRRREAVVAEAEATAAALEADAERAAAAVADGGPEGGEKEARRLLKEVQKRVVAVRAGRAAALLLADGCTLPRTVLLDLSALDPYAAEVAPA